ncbi:MAG: GNAT family N-acetyltransferase [Erythrobacter sp.]|nr:GNAT family N-acetyltransferase [Erythrobacter sp.]
MSSDWSLRLARVDDASAFHEVEEDAAQILRDAPELAGIAVPPSRGAEEYMRLIRRSHCLSAVEKDRVIGFAAAAPNKRELHLHELSVARSWQRRRIGATLLEALAIDARNSGLKAITLTTRRDIAWNAPFYAAHGFVEIANGEGSGEDSKDPNRCAMVRLLD